MKSYEKLLDQVGSFGTFQKRLCLYLIISSIPNGYFALSIVFVGIAPPHRCYVDKVEGLNFSSDGRSSGPRIVSNLFNNSQILELIPVNEKNKVSKCEIYINSNISTIGRNDNSTRKTTGCPDGWIYESDKTTIVTEWDFVCSYSWIRPTVASLFLIGVLTGALLSGFLSDRFGRRPLFLLGTASMFIFFGLCGFASSSTVYFVFIFLAGASNMVNYTTAFVLGSEIIGPKNRTLVGSLIIGGFALGYMFLPVVAYFTYDWRYVYFVLGLTGFLFIPYYWLIPESPRWFFCCGKHKEFRQAMMKIAKINGVSDGQITSIFDQFIDQSKQEEVQNTLKDFLQFLRHNTIKLQLLNISYSWFINAIIYYALSLNTSNLGGNPYWNCFIAGAVEIPAYAFCIFTLDKLGRKKVFQGTVFLSAISCGSVPFLKIVNNDLSIGVAMFGKFFISASFNILYIYTAELYPTSMRNSVVGIGSVCARLGAAVSPYLMYIENTSRYLPFLIMMILGFFCTIITYFLPETKDKPMLDLVDEKNLQKRLWTDSDKTEETTMLKEKC